VQGMDATPVIGEEHPPPCGHIMESLERPTAKVGTLGLQVRKKNRSGSAKKRARKAKPAEAPMGATEGGQSQSTAGGQPRDIQVPGTSVSQSVRGPAAVLQGSPPGGGHPNVSGKRQRPSGGTPEGGRLRSPSNLGRLAMPKNRSGGPPGGHCNRGSSQGAGLQGWFH
jgi:hypothetical protein